ncbi:MAG TPA: dihydrofolate reductase family protein [Thermomicrobiales bacterium]|jgi:dihydrofolate reductase|nr:dihydrofolate reductase family protein [Thermomicrobiales bacterium]
MRRVVAYSLVSLDGVAEEPGDWMFDVDDDIFANLERVIRDQDTVLLGRGTYDYWSDYWPTSDVQPFADFINGTPKIVYMSSTPATVWSNTSFIHEKAEDHVAALKRSGDGVMGIHGSITLVQSLLAANLIDELQLLVIPTIAGRGRRLFRDDGDLQRFKLRTVAGTPTGAVALHYARS